MKILFLDIDGVVNNSATTARHNNYIGIDPYMALLVNRICENTGAEIVLSSTWRLHPESEDEVRRHIFPHPMDKTPDLEFVWAVKRGKEIAAWRKEHPEIEVYAILDDDPAAGVDNDPRCFFQTSFEVGITDAIATKVIEHFNSANQL